MERRGNVNFIDGHAEFVSRKYAHDLGARGPALQLIRDAPRQTHRPPEQNYDAAPQDLRGGVCLVPHGRGGVPADIVPLASAAIRRHPGREFEKSSGHPAET